SKEFAGDSHRLGPVSRITILPTDGRNRSSPTLLPRMESTCACTAAESGGAIKIRDLCPGSRHDLWTTYPRVVYHRVSVLAGVRPSESRPSGERRANLFTVRTLLLTRQEAI